jgi:glyoxylase-like metal-dependent hydrolase (beta-lactamase superfamily II)
MQQIAHNIYAETEFLAPNVGCISTSAGAVLIDSPFLPTDAKHWGRQVGKLTKKNIAYLINTHCHFDHMLGNCFLTRRTIAHYNAFRGFEYYLNQNNLKKDVGMFWPEYLEKWEALFGEVEVIFPQIQFSDELSLFLGDVEVQVKAVGGHSSDSLWVYMPSAKVLFAGDLLENERHPGMVNAKFTTLLEVLRGIEKMEVDVVVPGHGPVGDKGVVTRQREYFEEMLGYVKKLKDNGGDKEETAHKVAEHMLSYLPSPEKEVEFNRNIVLYGAKRAFDQVG